MQDLNTFFKKVHQKWKYYRGEKQDFERFLIFLNIKLLTKLKKNELNEEFIAMWREEQSLVLVFHVAFHRHFVCTMAVYFCKHKINVASQGNYFRLLGTKAS